MSQIPQYVTHARSQLPPKKEKVPAPPLDTLQKLLDQGADSVVEMMLDEHYPLSAIRDGKIVDKLVGTERFLQKFITNNPLCIRMKEQARKCAKSSKEILIRGETGTGKEIIANSMIGDRTGLFVAINCAGMPEGLIESELFGHVRGAFTGADSSKQGLLARAKEGVAFLDEIGELSISVQAKLLRALQDKSVRRVGSNEHEPIDCKVVCATHRNLEKMQETGEFREDLFARIFALQLYIPPLRERVEDIQPIIESLPGGLKFLEALNKENKLISDIPLKYNVRSIDACITRYNVFGEVILS